MPPIEFGPSGPQAAKSFGIPKGAASAVDAKPVTAKLMQGRAVANDTARSHAAPNSAVMRSAALDPGLPPVDTDRVAEIRKAIERGQYPIVPAKVADAMIAAGLLLRSGK